MRTCVCEAGWFPMRACEGDDGKLAKKFKSGLFTSVKVVVFFSSEEIYNI